jgi:REP element-mobilizing transposase RayT
MGAIMKEKSIKIFISSTFKDMHSERDVLVKYVFPELKKRGLHYGLHIQEIDLRWGVTKEEAESGKALEICLDEIDQSRPFFIGLIGSRYGWVPPSYEINSHEKYDWLNEIIPGYSITALEIIHGVLKQTQNAPQAFFCFRDEAFLNDVPEEYHPMLIETEMTNQSKIQNLKHEIMSLSDKISVQAYHCKYKGIFLNQEVVKRILKDKLNEEDYDAILSLLDEDSIISPRNYKLLSNHLKSIVQELGQVYVSHLDGFANHLIEQLWQSIFASCGLAESSLDDEVAKINHVFALDRVHGIIARNDELKKILDYLKNNQTKPLFITGQPGSGKSTVMASLYLEFREVAPTLCLFCGINETTQTIKGVIDYLNQQLCILQNISYQLSEKEEYMQSVEMFYGLISSLNKEQTAYILIDGLDQLLDLDDPKQLDFVPYHLPNNIKLILSALPYHYLDQAKHLDLEIFHLPVLSFEYAEQMLTEGLIQYRKKLSLLQTQKILSKQEARLPLYLKVVQEVLRTFPRFEELDILIENIPQTIKALFVFVIDNLLVDYPSEMVANSLAILETSFQGVIESEIITMVELTLNKTYPMLYWSRFFRSISPYITNLSMDKNGHIRPFHHQFSLAIQKRFLVSPTQFEATHLIIANYGLSWLDFEKPFLTHTIAHLGYHLYHAKEDQKLTNLLINIYEQPSLSAYQEIPKILLQRVILDNNGEIPNLIESILERVLESDSAINSIEQLLVFQARKWMGQGYIDAANRLARLAYHHLQKSKNCKERPYLAIAVNLLYAQTLDLCKLYDKALKVYQMLNEVTKNLYEETKQLFYLKEHVIVLHLLGNLLLKLQQQEKAKHVYQEFLTEAEVYLKVQEDSMIENLVFSGYVQYIRLFQNEKPSKALALLNQVIERMDDSLQKRSNLFIDSEFVRAYQLKISLSTLVDSDFGRAKAFRYIYDHSFTITRKYSGNMAVRYQYVVILSDYIHTLIELKDTVETKSLLDRFEQEVQVLISLDYSNLRHRMLEVRYLSTKGEYYHLCGDDKLAYAFYLQAFEKSKVLQVEDDIEIAWMTCKYYYRLIIFKYEEKEDQTVVDMQDLFYECIGLVESINGQTPQTLEYIIRYTTHSIANPSSKLGRCCSFNACPA